jgi:hypothetical protein
MFSNLTIGFFMGAGFGAWLYAKLMRSTGGNTQNSLIVAVTAGFLTMIATAMLLGAFL